MLGRGSVAQGALASRRAVLGLGMVACALVLPGCATIRKITSRDPDDVVRRLLEVSTQRAFVRLNQPDGFWDSPVARIEVPAAFRGVTGQGGTSLQHALNTVAEQGARVAGPVVAEAVRTLTIAHPEAIVAGGRTAATRYLRESLGSSLANGMLPELETALRSGRDPALASLLAAVPLRDAAGTLAAEVETAIWYEIGATEAEIRAHPAGSNDAALVDGLARTTP